MIFRQLRRAPRVFGVRFAATSLFAVGTVVFSYVIGWATDSVLLPARRESRFCRVASIRACSDRPVTGSEDCRAAGRERAVPGR